MIITGQSMGDARDLHVEGGAAAPPIGSSSLQQLRRAPRRPLTLNSLQLVAKVEVRSVLRLGS